MRCFNFGIQLVFRNNLRLANLERLYIFDLQWVKNPVKCFFHNNQSETSKAYCSDG